MKKKGNKKIDNDDVNINIKFKSSILIKYLLMFIIMTIAIYYVPSIELEIYEIIMLGLISPISSIVLDLYFPK